MMRTIISVVILVNIGFNTFCQSIIIDTLKLPRATVFNEYEYDFLKFPMIRTGNSQIDSLINHDIKNKWTENHFFNAPIDSALLEWADDRVEHLDYYVTFNRDNIISLHICTQRIEAYCNSWCKYFNYSIADGRSLNITDVIDTSGYFKTIVLEQVNAQYNEQIKELENELNDEDSNLDQATFDFVLEVYENCRTSFDLDQFAIYPDYIEIIERCYMPNTIKNLTPDITLKYKNTEIHKYLIIQN